MSRYDWPSARSADVTRQGRDDAAGRLRFTSRLRVGLGRAAEAALAASRQAPRPATGTAGPRAPASGREHLWQPLGPATLLGGQAEGLPRVCGRVNAIVVHDGGQRLYAASANGGVWYSRDGGAHWLSVAGLASTNTAGILRPAQRNACGALHVEFGANEGEDLVFLGTGEVSSEPEGRPGSAERGIGILVGDQPVKSVAPDPWVREAPNLVNNGIYRIVREPGGSVVLAATRTGLYQRPAAPGKDVDWVRPTSRPFDTLGAPCTDLLWTAGHGGSPARLWVWVEEGDAAGLWVRDAGAADFVKVAVAGASPYGYTARRATLAAATPPAQVWCLNDRGDGTLPALFRVGNPAGPARPEALGVVGVPNVLRNQGFYDIAIAVDPGNANRVVLGGSWLDEATPDGAQGEYNAAIVVADVAADPGNGGRLTYGHPARYTMIGLGVHPDVQGLAYSNGGATLWACCDGGIFRSDAPARPAGFYARNHGLSISESNYIACHPRLEGHVVAGLQDNGTAERLSSGVWKETFKGDGGGLVLDAARPDRWLAQYTSGKWRDSRSSWAGPLRRGGAWLQPETDDAAFYSGAAAIAHVRTNPPAAPVAFGQTLIGTHRLWYSDSFGDPKVLPAVGPAWVTLPTATDPAAARPKQDDLGATIIACRWQDPDTAWVLTAGAVVRFTRTPGSHDGGTAGTWASPPQVVLRKSVKNKKDAVSADGPLRRSPTWTDIAVNVLPPPAAGQPAVGALYLGTVGHLGDAGIDTLWWFDGAGTWRKTGLREKGVPAPVIAIAVDPALPDEVWVGTTVGVWKGKRTQVAGQPPSWDWEQLVNGLPEAAVEDLALFRDGDLRLVRAAIASRGVWELRLDVADVQDLTYLRVHGDDLRHRPVSIALQRDGTTARSWHGSPDVRPRVAPKRVLAPSTLPWRRTTLPAAATEALRRFQAALRSSTGDPRIVAKGLWDPYFSELLRDRGAPVVAALNVPQIDKPFWELHMKAPHATAEPWGAGVPTEADLLEYTPELREGDRGRTSCELPAAACKVDVVVHHRGLEARDGAHVRVTLLKWIDPKKKDKASFSDPKTWFTVDVPWTAAVNEVLNSASGATPGALTAGWSFVGATNATRRLTLTGQTLDPLTAGVATFDLDLTGVKKDTVVLLVAVIRAGSGAGADLALNAASLEQLTLGNPQVAVRSVHVLGP